MSWGKTKPRMPSTKGVREWLPAGLSGGGSSGGGAPSQQVSVMSRMTNAMQPVSEGGRNMANMAGLPVSPANVSAFSACCPKLAFRERVYGCIGCFVMGIIISMFSFVSWFFGHTATWAILYTLGNIISLCGSGFLLGPRRQLRNMTKARRRIAAGVYFLMMIITFVGGFLRWSGLILLALVFCQVAPPLTAHPARPPSRRRRGPRAARSLAGPQPPPRGRDPPPHAREAVRKACYGCRAQDVIVCARV